jgi:hypothetical protein
MNASNETHRDPSASGSDSRDGGIAVVRSGRYSRSDGPRVLASTANDGLFGSLPEDSARNANRRPPRGTTPPRPSHGGADVATIATASIVSVETEQNTHNR